MLVINLSDIGINDNAIMITSLINVRYVDTDIKSLGSVIDESCVCWYTVPQFHQSHHEIPLK